MELFNGIEVIGDAPSINVYSTPQLFNQDHTGAMKRQEKGLGVINKLMPKGPNVSPGDIGLSSIPGSIEGLHETQRALKEVLESKEKDVLMWDLETLGTSKRSRIGRSLDTDFFDITQISLHNFTYNGEALKEAVKDPTVLSVGLSENTTKRLSSAIDLLEKDPNTLFNFNDDMKRSLADLTLFDSSKYFSKKEINGKNYAVMTGQANRKPSTKGTVLAQQEQIARMKMGLKNLTDPKLTNSREQVYEVLDSVSKQNPVLAGHNVQVFDKGNILEWLNDDKKTPKSILNFFKKDQIDTLPLSRQLYNVKEHESSNFQLSTLFNSVLNEGKSNTAGQAHFAGADTLMNGMLLNDELSRVKKNGLTQNVSQSIAQGDIFISERGTGSFYESAFNRNRGEHDITVRWDDKKKKWNQNYMFQESPVVAGHSYQYLGSAKDVEIDGIKHYSMVMQDLDNQTVKMIFRQDKEELTNLLSTNYTKIDPNETGTPAYLSRKKFIKEDNARRYYDSLFDSKMQNQGDTIAKRLDKSYKILDLYEDEVQKGFSGVNAIQNIQQKLNNGKPEDSLFRNSYEKIEKTVALKDRLLQERSVWEAATKDASQLFPLTENQLANNQAQNLFITNIHKEYEKLRPQAKKEYSYEGMKVLPINTLKNEITYMDVSSKGALSSRVQQTLRINEKRGKSAAVRDFENMLTQVGGTMDQSTMLELKTVVQKDISRLGKVDAGTMNYVSNKIYDAAKDSPKIVSSVPGKNILSAQNDGTSEAKRYLNALSPKKDSFYDSVVERAKGRTINSLSSETTKNNFKNFDLNNISEQASQRIKKSAEITQFFDERISSTGGIYKLDHGQRKKKVRSIDYNQRIKDVVKSFEDNSFVVNLDYLPENNDMVLFFAPKDKAPLLNNLSVNEKRFHKGIHQVSIPLMNDDASVNINGTGVMMQYKASYGKDKGMLGPNMTISNTPERAFNRMEIMGKKINEEIEQLTKEGKKIDIDAVIQKQISSYRHSVTNAQVSSSFYGDSDPLKAWSSSSRVKNIASGLTIDVSDYGDILLERENPTFYKQFRAWQKAEGKEHVNFINSGWNPKSEPFSIRNKVNNQLTTRWNEEYGNGTETGVHITRQGLNTKQSASGKAAAQDVRLMTPFGELNPATREQILKTPNYQPLNTKELETYLRESVGMTDEAAIQRRLLGGIAKTADEYANLPLITAERGSSGIGVRTSYTGQDELQEGVRRALKDVRKEIDEKTSLKATLSGEALTNIESELKGLENLKQELSSGRISVSDGQMVVPKSFADSLVSQSNREIRLKTGYELPSAVQERILEKTNGQAFTAGTLRFDRPMSYNELLNSEMITKEGLLTVGNLVEETIKEDAEGIGKELAGNQRYRIYENSEVLGIQRTAKGDKLILNQVQTAKSGSKVIDGIIGTRNTIVSTSDEAFNRVSKHLGGRNVQTIQEPINIGRNPWGGVLGTTIEATFENAMEDLDRVAAGGDASLPAVQKWIAKQKGKGISTQDLSRQEITEQFVSDVFKKDLSNLGVDSIVSLNKQANRLVYSPVSELGQNANNLIGEKGQANYAKFLTTAATEYGFDEKNAYTRVRSHAVDDYAGVNTKARLSIREMNLLETKLNHQRDVIGEDGTLKVVGASGRENPIFKKYEWMMDNQSKENHLDLAGRIQKAQPFLGKGDNIENILQPNNLILDMTGQFQGSQNQNVILGKNNELIFDATSLGELPSRSNRTKNDMKGTMADPMSIVLNNEELGIVNETVEAYQKRTGGQAFLQIGNPHQKTDMGTPTYQKNYIPIIGNMDDTFSAYEEVNIRDIQKHTEDIYSSVRSYNTRNYSTQNLSQDEIMKSGIKYTQQTNNAIESLGQEINYYTTTSGKAGMIKGTNTLRSKQGLSAKSGSFNFYDTYQQLEDGSYGLSGKRKESEFFTSRQNASLAIDGIEKEIFEANKLTVGELSKAEVHEEILNRMTGTRMDDDAFDVVSSLNRFPSQSKGSVNFMSMRIDESMTANKDSRFLISNYAASNMGADYDGDVIYSVLDHYRKAGKSEDLTTIQKALVRERDSMERAARKAGVEGELGSNAFKEILSLEGAKRDAFFNNFTDEVSEGLSSISNSVKATGIGSMDNAMVANRDLLGYVYGESLNRNVINATQYHEAVNSFDKVSDLVVQNFISAKKLTPESMGVTAEVLESMTSAAKSDFILSQSEKYLNTQSELPMLLRNVNKDNIDQLMGKMNEIGVIGEGQENLFRDAFSHIAVAQEATQNYGGVKGVGFAAGKSSGDRAGRLVESIIDSPETVLPTPNVTRYVESLFGRGSDIGANYFESIDKTGAAVAENVSRINLSSSGIEAGFSDAAESQLANMTEFLRENKSARKNLTSSEVLDTLKSKTASALGSNAFKVGAGFSAMWMLGSAIKGGPTPEGSEAQQEATPQEMNPAALLTSPTARVTPNGENVRLKVSGSGNVDHSTVSGIVDQQVSSMTGIPMNTNVNISDNTQQLDKSFYEQAMDRILGF